MMGFMGNSDDKGKYASLEQNLVGPAPDEILPTATAMPMMEVVAPATLREGYEFQANVGDQSFTVTVPPGGVEQGQRFSIPYEEHRMRGSPKMNVPVGAWKDSIFNCFEYGPCHNHLCLSCWFVPIAVGHTITRLQLTWTGRPGTVSETTGAFHYLLYGTISFWTVYFLLGFAIGDIPYTDFAENLIITRAFLWYLYLGFTVFLVWNVRSHMRAKYAIPEEEFCLTGCADFGMALCCTHLAAAQMLRHTADYDVYNATCCTDNGLPACAPSIV